MTDAKTNQRVEMRMVFSDKQSGMMTFELEPTLQQSNNLIWTFETQFGWDLFSRYVGLFLDDMIGKNYERGLETLKQRAERASQDILSTTLGRTSGYHLLGDSLTFTGRDDFVEQMNLDSGERSVLCLAANCR